MSNVETSVWNKPLVLEDSNSKHKYKLPKDAHEKEVNDLYEHLKFERNKYAKYKIIQDALEECIDVNSELDQNLKTKVRDILLSGSVVQCLSLEEFPSNESRQSVLGLIDINQHELNYMENKHLQDVLKRKLEEKYETVCDDFRKTTSKDIENTLENIPSSVPLQMVTEDKILLDLKDRLLLEQEQYVKNLSNQSDLLSEITDARLKKVPELTEHKIKEYQIKEKLNHVKSSLMQEKVRVDVFTEANGSLQAYKELIKDIKDQQSDCEKEIQRLMDLKEKYSQVSCKQYDDILKSYLQYKATIEKKKLLYETLKS
ncbi:hypothetical protein NQ315_004200 [Exocentrus adspersus]|uniref:Uncharacterized protein n=1 Tax=Exocentrus adspersus TaxID=1586481 RepID=A0AAV8W6M5_9CUCU|nr:hypothetical protein NQ315_004200 [Exocentrus adspersus]